MVRRGSFFVAIISVGSNYDDDGIKNKRPAFLPNSSSKQQHARVASSVRGGSITQHVRSKHSSNSRNTNHYGSKKNNSGSHHQSRRNHQLRHSRHPSSSSSATFAPYRRRHSHHQRHGKTLEESDMDEFNSDHDTDGLEEE